MPKSLSKNLCVITLNHPNNNQCSGADIDSWNLAKKLAGNGHEVHFITIGDKAETYSENGVNIQIIEKYGQGFFRFLSRKLKISYFGAIEYLAAGLSFNREIQKLARQKNIQIVHMPEGSGIGLFYLIKNNKKRLPVIMKLHSPIFFHQKYNDQKLKFPFQQIKKINNAINNFTEKFCIKKADKVYCPSHFLADEITAATGRKDIIIIPNSIDLELYKKSATNKNALKNPVVLCVSRICKAKGIEILIKAALEILKVLPNAVFKFIGYNAPIGAGSTTCKEYLQKTYCLEKHPNIIFEGQINQQQLLKNYQNATILAHPSLMENCPLTILEAMASHLPIIAFAVGGIPEIITNNQNGILIKPYAQKEFTKNLLKLLQQKNLRNDISTEAYKKIKKYSWSNNLKKIEDIFENLTNEQARN